MPSPGFVNVQQTYWLGQSHQKIFQQISKRRRWCLCLWQGEGHRCIKRKAVEARGTVNVDGGICFGWVQILTISELLILHLRSLALRFDVRLYNLSNTKVTYYICCSCAMMVFSNRTTSSSIFDDFLWYGSEIKSQCQRWSWNIPHSPLILLIH